MTTNLSKTKAYQQFKYLENHLKETIGNNKKSIISRVKSKTSYNHECEGVFIKSFLSKNLLNMFLDNIIIEGIDSKGKTQFKKSFFGSKPAPDFVINNLLTVVGEVKYDSLTARSISLAIGQVLVYLKSSKYESYKYDYGCIIFFDKSCKSDAIGEKEAEFIKYLWEHENIYLIII